MWREKKKTFMLTLILAHTNLLINYRDKCKRQYKNFQEKEKGKERRCSMCPELQFGGGKFWYGMVHSRDYSQYEGII